MTAGEYSDYHICAVFDSRQAAEVYCALGHGESVEDYDVQSGATVKPAPSIIYRYRVERPGRGTDWIWEPVYLLEDDVEEDKNTIAQARRFDPPRYNVIDCDYHVDRYVYLKERNKSKALKIVRDRIAAAKAEREGL